MNNLVISTDNIYLRFYKIYSVVKDYCYEPAVYKWSWRKFRNIEVISKKPIVKLRIAYCCYNEVSKKLENDNFTITYTDHKLAEEAYKKMVDQLLNQDPTLRYVDDALESALKGTDD